MCSCVTPKLCLQILERPFNHFRFGHLWISKNQVQQKSSYVLSVFHRFFLQKTAAFLWPKRISPWFSRVHPPDFKHVPNGLRSGTTHDYLLGRPGTTDHPDHPGRRFSLHPLRRRFWNQLMLNWWFGTRWFGYLGSPKLKGIGILWGIPKIPNHQPKPPTNH